MDLLGFEEVDGNWIKGMVSFAESLKTDPGKYCEAFEGKILSMVFMKPSTRTRVSFEAGFAQLGGHAIYIDWRTSNFTKGNLQDEVKCVDRYSDIIMARVFKHQEIVDIADSANKPVINGLSDFEHPCQALADIMTVHELIGSYDFKLAYVGDGNNVCNSLIYGCCKVGGKISVATPKGYEPNGRVLEFGLKNGLYYTHDPSEAVVDADVVYTDVWVSMGDESDAKARMSAFKGYQVTRKLLGDSYFMHCLPAIRGNEVTDEVMDSKKSVIFDQAENRMHAQKALMLSLIGK